MALNQHASNLIDITIKAFNGDISSVSQTDGLSLVTSWLSYLQANNQGNMPIVDALHYLSNELQSNQPDGKLVLQILETLIDQIKQTSAAVDSEHQSKLNSLTDALQGFSDRVTGKIKLDTTDDQAPMTSTVGPSAVNTDPISNRNVAATSSGSENEPL